MNTNTWLVHLCHGASNTGADFLVYWDSWLLFISGRNEMLHRLKISTGRVFAAHTSFSNDNLYYWRPTGDQTGGILPSCPVAFLSWRWQEFRIDIVTTVRGGRKMNVLSYGFSSVEHISTFQGYGPFLFSLTTVVRHIFFLPALGEFRYMKRGSACVWRSGAAAGRHSEDLGSILEPSRCQLKAAPPH